MRLREVEEAEKKQMMKERQQKLLEGQLVRRDGITMSRCTPSRRGHIALDRDWMQWDASPTTHLLFQEQSLGRDRVVLDTSHHPFHRTSPRDFGQRS